MRLAVYWIAVASCENAKTKVRQTRMIHAFREFNISCCRRPIASAARPRHNSRAAEGSETRLPLNIEATTSEPIALSKIYNSSIWPL